ncbi:MAG: hypothetical protein HHJ11_13050 [Phycicoccus sp.]|nr:hypothetical protein [Phycicoccus sp.]NMM35145.1 hypothetical protein [Phycicoccus sp.]
MTTLSPSFSLPLYKFPMTSNALTFRLTVTPANGTVVSATFKVHAGSLAGTVLVAALVTAGPPPVFSMRATNAAAPATNPLTVWIESTVGGTAGSFTVTAG